MRRARCGLLLALSFALGCQSCATQNTKVEVKRAVGANTGAHGGKRPRLAWVAWDDENTLVVCNRRVDDNGNPVGILGPCSKVGSDGVMHRMVSWLNTEGADKTFADATPYERCTLELEDAQLVPAPKPAKLFLVGPTGKQELEHWTPEGKLTADAYHLEVTFSPEMTWMAVVRVAIGLGEGERTIEVVSASLLPLPTCAAN